MKCRWGARSIVNCQSLILQSVTPTTNKPTTALSIY